MKYFTMMIKPASALCNMRCKYCFYSDVSEHRELKNNGIMEENTVDNLLKRVFEYLENSSEISFVFQGGEPTLAGISYFQYFVENVNKLNVNGHAIHYSIQTNGYLIDEEFCGFLKQNNFLVGISLDGPKEINDCNRIDSNMEGTYDCISHTIELFDKYKIDYNILSVITKQMVKKAQSLFDYYLKSNIQYVQLIPCLKSLDYEGEKEIKKHDLTPEEYARFLKELFELWYKSYKNNHYISIRQFDNLIFMLRGEASEQCGLDGRCNLQCVVESDGSIYPCDFYVLDQFRQGNVHHNSIEEILWSDGSKSFLDYKVPESKLCKSCKVYPLCAGGCKRYRSFYSESKGYCPNQDFLYTTYSKLLEIAKSI